jgi:predicted aspartyl protease
MKPKPQNLLCCLLVTVFVSSARAGGKQQVVEVPFDFYRNEIILQVKVNGKGPFNMMLDTGTDPSAVDLTTARDIGLKLHPLGKPATGGGTDVNLTYYTELPLVEVGSFTVKDVETLALDLSKVSQRLGKPLHGVLGHSVLNGRIVQIDYLNRVVRFYSQPLFSKASNTPKRSVLSFRYADNVLLDDVFVNGKKVVGNLDTGSNGTFNLTPAAVVYLGLEEEFNQAPVSTDVGYNGVSQNRQGKVNNVTVGGISVDEPAVIFFGKGTGQAGHTRTAGITVGAALCGRPRFTTLCFNAGAATEGRPYNCL